MVGKIFWEMARFTVEAPQGEIGAVEKSDVYPLSYLLVIQFSTNIVRSSMSTVPAGRLRSQYVFQ